MNPRDQEVSNKRKLKWVTNEFIIPAFEQFKKEHDGLVSMTEFDEFAENLFTEKSKVRVLAFSCRVDHVFREILYELIIGIVDANDTVMSSAVVICKQIVK
ncbi:MAG: hypothetical protein IKA36_02205 [Clostridia bacterium]|nr:hypothetical protein [Clostridia bacterium]